MAQVEGVVSLPQWSAHLSTGSVCVHWLPSHKLVHTCFSAVRLHPTVSTHRFVSHNPCFSAGLVVRTSGACRRYVGREGRGLFAHG